MEILHSAIRVDHAGEVAANWIYQGQLAIFGRDAKVGSVIEVCI
jgi:ubiquinone biosynthesis monooxygenase Coq7